MHDRYVTKTNDVIVGTWSMDAELIKEFVREVSKVSHDHLRSGVKCSAT